MPLVSILLFQEVEKRFSLPPGVSPRYAIEKNPDPSPPQNSLPTNDPTVTAGYVSVLCSSSFYMLCSCNKSLHR